MSLSAARFARNLWKNGGGIVFSFFLSIKIGKIVSKEESCIASFVKINGKIMILEYEN